MSLEGIDKLLEVIPILYNERMMELIEENKKLKERIESIETKRTIYMCYEYDMIGRFYIDNTSYLFNLPLKDAAEKYIEIYINQIQTLINRNDVNISYNFNGYCNNFVKYDITYTSITNITQINYMYFTDNPTLYKKFVLDNFNINITDIN